MCASLFIKLIWLQRFMLPLCGMDPRFIREDVLRGKSFRWYQVFVIYFLACDLWNEASL